MKKTINILILFIFSLILPFTVDAKEQTKIILFHKDTCPHCKEEIKYLNKIKEKYDDIKIEMYEVTDSKENISLMNDYIKKFKIDRTVNVPFTIVNDKYTIGFSKVIEKRLDDYIKGEINTNFDLPIIGEVDAKSVSIPLVSGVIGLIDGFNPCAMWILLFLISSLLGMKDRKRMWIIGLSFLITSSLVYMGFLLSWIKVVDTIATSNLFMYVISVVALIGGIINIRGYRKETQTGCTVVDQKKRTKIFTKIKKFTTEQSLIIAVLGAMALAVSVNLVELACSAGFPLIYTQILEINNVTGIESLFYTLIYILFFLLDDIVVFVIAMTTMKATGISTKYNRYSKLVSGIIMLIIGLLMIFKPEWLMFNI